MRLSFDSVKRDLTLRQRGLDFMDARLVFSGDTLDIEDDRTDYGEQRMISIGVLDKTAVVIVWTVRGDTRRVISMRKASRGEREAYQQRMGRP